MTYIVDMRRHAPGRVPVGVKLRRVVWNVASAVLFRPFVTPLFAKWRIAILKLFGAEVAWDSNVYASARIWAPWRLRMGRRSCLGPGVTCYNQDWVVLEDDVVVSQHAYLCTAGHDVDVRNTAERSLVTSPIVLRAESWVGARSFIGMGVEVGEGSIVGATASVYKTVEPWTVVGGNPANVIKMRRLRDLTGGGYELNLQQRGWRRPSLLDVPSGATPQKRRA